MIRFAVLTLLILGGCQATTETETEPEELSFDEAERVFEREVSQITAYADSIERLLWPVSLLTSAEAAAFRRYRNDDQLEVARRIGVRPPVDAAARQRLIREGKLVPLVDTQYWAVRDLTHSMPLVVPEMVTLLNELGRGFHSRLEKLGLPPLRIEITSVLRTEEDQARLRRTNPNAVSGTSTHQFGTTIDVTYASFRAPLEPVLVLDTVGAPWLGSGLRRMEQFAIEVGAARMARELKAELAEVLRELQDQGKVMVTMERRQPVFHMTVAKRLPAPRQPLLTAEPQTDRRISD